MDHGPLTIDHGPWTIDHGPLTVDAKSHRSCLWIAIFASLIALPLTLWGQQPSPQQKTPPASTQAAPRETAPSPAAVRPQPADTARPQMPPAAQTPTATAQGSVRLPVAEPAPEPRETRPAEGEKSAEGSPETKDKKAMTQEVSTPGGEEKVYLNVQDQDIKDIIKQISKASGKNFIIDDKVRGKVTIMSEKLMTKEEAYQAFLSALEVAGFTTVTGPGGIIKIVALKDAMSSPIPIHMDSTPYTDSYVTRLISLQNISALDMSNAIKGLISKSGNMFAYPATNTLIITDSGTNIDRLMKLIKELDQEGPQQVLEIIPVNYADAKDIAQKVLQLFEIEQKGAAAVGKKAPGGELEEIKDVSKIIADERTNSLIVLASKRAIDKVRDIIAKLDVPLEVGDTGTIHVHYLKYANAVEMAETLSAITSGAAPAPVPKAGGKDGKAPAAKDAPPPVAQLEGGISIGADESTNALIITASAKDYETLVAELISKLDIPRRQVYLESIVMELEVQKGTNVGMSGFGGAGNRSILGFGTSGSSELNVLQGLFNPASFFATPGMLGGVLSRDTVTINVPNSSGGSTAMQIPAFAAFLNLLQTYRDANIVSTPNILTLDNQKASIEVTRKIYANKTTTFATAGSTVAEPVPLEAGLTLEITPQITEGDAVKLEIHQKLSNFTGPPNAQTGAAPETKREITTTVMAMDNQTVVLGGLMEDVVLHSKTKVPILGDIPIIGLLFRSSKTENTKNNLLVFITPHVIKDPSDFADISKMKIEQRNKFIGQNYGKRQRQQIRDTIATHRADLLEFTPPVESSSSSYTAPANPPSEAPAGQTNGRSGPAAPQKQPVISVPPLGGNISPGDGAELSMTTKTQNSPAAKTSNTQNSKNKKGVTEIDMAY